MCTQINKSGGSIPQLVLHRKKLASEVLPSPLLSSPYDRIKTKNKTIGIHIPVRLWWMQSRAVMYSLINQTVRHK